MKFPTAKCAGLFYDIYVSLYSIHKKSNDTFMSSWCLTYLLITGDYKLGHWVHEIILKEIKSKFKIYFSLLTQNSICYNVSKMSGTIFINSYFQFEGLILIFGLIKLCLLIITTNDIFIHLPCLCNWWLLKGLIL